MRKGIHKRNKGIRGRLFSTVRSRGCYAVEICPVTCPYWLTLSLMHITNAEKVSGIKDRHSLSCQKKLPRSVAHNERWNETENFKGDYAFHALQADTMLNCSPLRSSVSPAHHFILKKTSNISEAVQLFKVKYEFDTCVHRTCWNCLCKKKGWHH